jgi:GNAT superfamily N-acetyltransferase
MNSHVPTTDFAVESFIAVYPEAKELLVMHWDEIAPYRELLTINPDLQMYKTLEDAGKLCVVTARQMGELIGYVVMMIHAHHHYSHVIVATEDIHFLHPAFRKGSLGLRLIAAAEKEMVRRGARLMMLRTKVSHDHGLLFTRLGYVAQDIVYTKKIGN